MDSIEPSIDTKTCRAEMIRIVEHLFHTMLDRQVAVVAHSLRLADDALTAVISFSGAWHGALCLQCSERQAKLFAQLFMGDDSGERDEERRDVMAELANIIAGNLKVILPHGAQSSLPAVFTGNALPPESAAPIVVQTAFELDKQIFSLVLANDAS